MSSSDDVDKERGAGEGRRPAIACSLAAFQNRDGATFVTVGGEPLGAGLVFGAEGGLEALVLVRMHPRMVARTRLPALAELRCAMQDRAMGKGGYNGGSTIIGPGSRGWFGKPRAKPTPEEHAAFLKRQARRKAAGAAERRAKALERAAAHAEKMAKRQKHRDLKAASPPQQDPVIVAAKLARHMDGVIVEVRRDGRTRPRKPAGI
ncbi:hypothetical protein [Sphingomonas sp.]|uniref:hypothetical protein n=1 Tax=Sphingomonas sp. TaxID=28214 RepID=UPI0035C7FE2D